MKNLWPGSDPKDASTSPTPAHGASNPSPDAGGSGGSMPSSLGAVVGAGGGGGDPGQMGGQAAPAAEPRSALVDDCLGELGGAGFELMALKTGHDHWSLTDQQRENMAEAVEAVAQYHGIGLSPRTNPWACLTIGVVGYGLPRLLEELRLLRAEMKLKREAEAARNKEASPE
jgi:hypothetical protein